MKLETAAKGLLLPASDLLPALKGEVFSCKML
jgi:hypothetical protein